MSYYNNAPPEQAILIEQGWPVYLFGNRQSVDAQFYLSNVALTGNVATITVTQWSGPNVGASVAAPGTVTPVGSTTGGSLAAATYFYKVTALNANGETTASPEASVTTTGTTSSVALTWAAVAGATSYRVYRGTAAAGENVFYTTTTASYTDTGAASTGGTPPTANSALIVGGFISIKGTQTNAGVFNVINVPITSATLDPTGSGTISFALTNANVASTPDAGQAFVRFAPVGDAFTAAVASIPGAVGNDIGRNVNSLGAEVYMPTGTATVTLQGSNRNDDASFADLYTFTFTNGRASNANIACNLEFVRFKVSAVTVAGSIVASVTA